MKWFGKRMIKQGKQELAFYCLIQAKLGEMMRMKLML